MFRQVSEDEALNTAAWLFAGKCHLCLQKAKGGEDDSEYS